MSCCCEPDPCQKKQQRCCGCSCSCSCKPLQKGKFGLAYIVETPRRRCVQPAGWQVEFEDTPSRVSNNCDKMIRWASRPPIGCVCGSCPPKSCAQLLECGKCCCAQQRCCCCSCCPELSYIEPACCCGAGCCSSKKQKKRRQRHNCNCSDSDLDEDDSLDYIPKKETKRDRQRARHKNSRKQDNSTQASYIGKSHREPKKNDTEDEEIVANVIYEQEQDHHGHGHDSGDKRYERHEGGTLLEQIRDAKHKQKEEIHGRQED